MTLISIKRCILFALILLTLERPSTALSQGVGEGEFSNGVLAYKLERLNGLFWQTEQKLSARLSGKSNLDELKRIWHEKNHLEARFLGGNFYPDLLDEQIVMIREELRLILADRHQIVPRPEAGGHGPQTF